MHVFDFVSVGVCVAVLDGDNVKVFVGEGEYVGVAVVEDVEVGRGVRVDDRVLVIVRDGV